MKKFCKKKEYLNGEFIPTFFEWKTLEKQKEIVSKLENITKPKKED